MESVLKVCYVVWTDVMHFKRDGWLSHDELQTLIDEASGDELRMKSVGWLVHQDDEKLVITGTVNGFSVSDVVVIPRVLVKDFRVLDDPPADPESGPVPVVVLDESLVGEVVALPLSFAGAQPVKRADDDGRAQRIAFAAAQGR